MELHTALACAYVRGAMPEWAGLDEATLLERGRAEGLHLHRFKRCWTIAFRAWPTLVASSLRRGLTLREHCMVLFGAPDRPREWDTND